MELKETIGGNSVAWFDEERRCIAVSPDFLIGDTIIYFTAESIAKLAAFSQRVQCELASRQNFSLPELKTTETVLLPAPKP